MAKILLTGGSGQVGHAIQSLRWPEQVVLVAPERVTLDLASPEGLSAYLGAESFDAVLSVGAYTAVDKAESDVATAWTVNAIAPALLAKYAAEKGIPIIHVSTDYVFDGSKPAPYVELDPVVPLGVYGASKEGGEQAVRSACARHVILRTSWVVSAFGNNFVKTMMRLGRVRSELRIVADQQGAPTFAGDLAAAIQTILLRQLADADAPTGTLHCSNQGHTTWFDFASAIFEEAGKLASPVPQLHRIKTSDYPTPARRPLNSRLDTSRLTDLYRINLPDWRDSLIPVVRSLLSEQRVQS